MKSEPGRSVVYTSTRGGGGLVSEATKAAPGSGVVARAWAACAALGSATTGFATNAAAPAAAPLRNPRRLTEPFFELGMIQNLLCAERKRARSVSAIARNLNRSAQ